MDLRKEIDASISRFKPISLQEMDSVCLMNRFDLKFVFPIALVSGLLKQLATNHSILEINNQRWFSYQTTYFDTSKFSMFTAHVTQRAKRHKIRLRNYVNTNASFLEIKVKNISGKTSKERIKIAYDVSQINKATSFLSHFSPYLSSELVPVLKNDFQRLTLVNDAMNMRITFDNMISYIQNGNTINLPNVAIMEVKFDKNSSQKDSLSLMKEAGIRSSGFSKYCIGAGLLYPQLKTNYLKHLYLKINQINYDTI